MPQASRPNPELIELLELLERQCLADAEFLRDALWLAQFVPPGEKCDPPAPPKPVVEPAILTTTPKPAERTREQPDSPPQPRPALTRSTPIPDSETKLYPAATLAAKSAGKAVPIYIPASGALPQPLELARALRPFQQKFRSRVARTLDVNATVEVSADRREITPVLVRQKERWFSLSLLVDNAPSMVVWRKTARELSRFLAGLGIFRDVRSWSVDHTLRLTGNAGHQARPKQLADPSGRTLIVVLTNGVGPHWQSRELAQWLTAWARTGPVAICSLLPPLRWQQTDLGPAYLWARAASPGAGNRMLTAGEGPKATALKDGATIFPVFPLTKQGLEDWAAMQMSRRESRVSALPIAPQWFDPLTDTPAEPPRSAEETAQRVAEFSSFASPDAVQLLRLFSAIPLSLPVMRLVQHTMLPQSPLSAMAEVLMSGLVAPHTATPSDDDPESALFDFTSEARKYLRDRTSQRELDAIQNQVMGAIEEYIRRSAGISHFDFEAWVEDPEGYRDLPEDAQYFAHITAETLRALGYRRNVSKPVPPDERPAVFVAWNGPELETLAREIAAQLKQRGLRILIEGRDPLPTEGSVLLIANRTDLFDSSGPFTEALARFVESGLDGAMLLGPGVTPGGESYLFCDSYPDRAQLIDALIADIAKRDVKPAPPVRGAPPLDRQAGFINVPEVDEVNRLIATGTLILFSNEAFPALPVVRDLVWTRELRARYQGGIEWLRERAQPTTRPGQLLIFEKPDMPVLIPEGCSAVLLNPEFPAFADLPDSTQVYEGNPETTAKIASEAADGFRNTLPESLLLAIRHSPHLVEFARYLVRSTSFAFENSWTPPDGDRPVPAVERRLWQIWFDALPPPVRDATGIMAALQPGAPEDLRASLVSSSDRETLRQRQLTSGPDDQPTWLCRWLATHSPQWPRWHQRILEAMGVLKGDWFNTVANNAYARQNLIHHMLQAGNLTFIEKAEVNFAWWELRIEHDGAASLVQELLSLPAENPPLSQIRTFLVALPNAATLSVDDYAAAISRYDLPLPQVLRDAARLRSQDPAQNKPAQFILLAGPRTTPETTLDPPIQWAVEAIAREIGIRGLGLICGAEPGCDQVALRQWAAMHLPGLALRVVTNSDNPVPTEDQVSRSVPLADAVILLGGHHWVERTGREALSMGKRLFPIPAFGGAAEALFKEQNHPNVPWASSVTTKEDADRLAAALLDEILATETVYPQTLLSEWSRFIGPEGDKFPLFDWRITTPTLSSAALQTLIHSTSAEERIIGFCSFWLHPQGHDSTAVVRAARERLEAVPSIMERYIALGVLNVALLQASAFPDPEALPSADSLQLVLQDLERMGSIRAKETHDRAINLRRQLEIVESARQLANAPSADSARHLGRFEPPYGKFELENHLQRGPGGFLRLFAYTHLSRKPNADLLDLLIECLTDRETLPYGLDLGLQAIDAMSKGHPLSPQQQDKLLGLEPRIPETARSLLTRLTASHHDPSTRVELEVVPVSARPGVVYKDNPSDTSGPWVVTRGTHELHLPPTFRMGVYPVTNRQYLEFMNDGGYRDTLLWGAGPASYLTSDKRTPGPATWSSAQIPAKTEEHPVSGVCFYEAQAFTRWLQKKHPVPGFQWSLPTEDMWEYCARAARGSLYPWGDDFEKGRCNCSDTGLWGASEVTQFPNGRSALGCHDMAGNVWEFVIPANPQTGGNCVLRGGSYLNTSREIRNCFRLTEVPPNHRAPDFGFRCALIPIAEAPAQHPPAQRAKPRKAKRPIKSAKKK